MGSSEIYPHLKRFKQSIKIPGEPLYVPLSSCSALDMR